MKTKLKAILLKFFHSYVWLFLVLILFDQFTKLLAHFNTWNFAIIPNFFYFTYTRNTGAAWNMFDGNMAALAVVSGVVGTGIIVFRVVYRHKLNALKKILLAVILAGTWGNFIDRAFYKLFLGSEGVVDFIMFKFGSYIYPIFNVADICVTLGIISFAIVIAVEDYYIEKKKKSAKEVSHEPDEDQSNE